MPDDHRDEEADETPPSGDTLGSSGGAVTLGDLLALLSDDRRRSVLEYFESESADVFEVEDVADAVAERERTAGDAGPGPGDRPRRIVVALHHNHLPRLDDGGLLDYDPRSRTVRYWGEDRVGTLLDAFDEADG